MKAIFTVYVRINMPHFGELEVLADNEEEAYQKALDLVVDEFHRVGDKFDSDWKVREEYVELCDIQESCNYEYDENENYNYDVDAERRIDA